MPPPSKPSWAGMVTPTQQAAYATDTLARKANENIGRGVTEAFNKASGAVNSFMTGLTAIGVGLGLRELAGLFGEATRRFANFEEGMIRTGDQCHRRAKAHPGRDVSRRRLRHRRGCHAPTYLAPRRRCALQTSALRASARFGDEGGRARKNNLDIGELARLGVNLDRPRMLLHDDVVSDG